MDQREALAAELYRLGDHLHPWTHASPDLRQRYLAAVTDRTLPSHTLADAIARLLADQRHGPGVSMDGSHNPTVSETERARRFVRRLLPLSLVPAAGPDVDGAVSTLELTTMRNGYGPPANKNPEMFDLLDDVIAVVEAHNAQAAAPAPEAVYLITRFTDFTEGRSFVTDSTLFASEQDAWDQVNDLPGVQGSHPSTWSRAEGKFPTWQAFAAAGHRFGDYTVRRQEVRPTSRPDHAPSALDLSDLNEDDDQP